jgi:hypothetical protein
MRYAYRERLSKFDAYEMLHEARVVESEKDW